MQAVKIDMVSCVKQTFHTDEVEYKFNRKNLSRSKF